VPCEVEVEVEEVDVGEVEDVDMEAHLTHMAVWDTDFHLLTWECPHTDMEDRWEGEEATTKAITLNIQTILTPKYVIHVINPATLQETVPNTEHNPNKQPPSRICPLGFIIMVADVVMT